MKRLLVLLLITTTGCATYHKHPTLIVVTGLVGGAGVGLIVASTTRNVCPSVINGYHYQGTPPCPGPNYDPGFRKRQ